MPQSVALLSPSLLQRTRLTCACNSQLRRPLPRLVSFHRQEPRGAQGPHVDSSLAPLDVLRFLAHFAPSRLVYQSPLRLANPKAQQPATHDPIRSRRNSGVRVARASAQPGTFLASLRYVSHSAPQAAPTDVRLHRIGPVGKSRAQGLRRCSLRKPDYDFFRELCPSLLPACCQSLMARKLGLGTPAHDTATASTSSLCSTRFYPASHGSRGSPVRCSAFFPGSSPALVLCPRLSRLCVSSMESAAPTD